jgi:molybdopterin-containing oxidoreductase family membrane subunit
MMMSLVMFYLHSLCGFKRTSIIFSFVLSIVNIGMWFERFVIVLRRFLRSYLPSSWTMFFVVDIGIFIEQLVSFLYCFYCTLGLFLYFKQGIKTILKGTGIT